jgi:transposase-like protein
MVQKGHVKTWRSGPPSQSPGHGVLLDLYVEQELSYAEIARRHEVSTQSVMRWLRAAGIPPRPAGRRKGTKDSHPRPPETIERLRVNIAKARASVTPEGRQRQREKMKGRTPPNKGVPWSAELRAKHEATRSTPEYREKMAAYQRGEKSHLWNGGISAEAEIYLHGWPWRKRRKEAYERDGYACQDCGTTEASLQAHHIVPRRHGGGDELENLVTLCLSCHPKREHKYLDALFG